MLSINELIVAWEHRDTLTEGNWNSSVQDSLCFFFLVNGKRECGYAF